MFFDAYTESILIFAGINIIVALSAYLPLAAGQPSLGQGGFMAIGAYLSAYLTVEYEQPFLPSLLVGGIGASVIGLLVGFPALRLRGIYLAVMTLGFGEMVRVFFLNFSPTGGAKGLGGIYPHTGLLWVYAAIAVLIIFFYRLEGSRMGRALEAIKEDELAAEVMGVNPTGIKLRAFGIGALIAGIGGGLYAHYALFIDSSTFGFSRSAEIIVFVILGGMNTFWGSVLGAVVLTVLPELLRFIQEWRIEFYGTLVLLMMIFRPQGLLGRKILTKREN